MDGQISPPASTLGAPAPTLLADYQPYHAACAEYLAREHRP